MLDRNHTVFAAVFNDGSVHFNAKLTVIGMHEAGLIVLDTIDEGLVIWKSRWPVESQHLSMANTLTLISNASMKAREQFNRSVQCDRRSGNKLVAS